MRLRSPCQVWVLIDRDDYPFAAYSEEARARARATAIGEQRRQRSPGYFRADIPAQEQAEMFAPAVCELTLDRDAPPEEGR